ncbi:hypothetical protein BKA67DRAFT_537820 [Truncatella angustata]|uniref:histidine kinase n=1 Tax=Truncatella angustata TaxID=152316 RepID=A0A9P8UGW6_9PEZI|nr:uncharacterized protein BKA67DRAFT_537820 [Truncatella angustata]KAH6651970.1 hypothetical protein BKA67DRAFT_537820 [Truncatella angustata]KAH8205693.1 hypothetical protein TruAng_000187 [Truncatella angustata]
MSCVSEVVRERETYRYTSRLVDNARAHSTTIATPGEGQTDDITKTSLCADTTLTAFAQLSAFRLNATRCLISVFDRKNQYVVAEATVESPIVPEVDSQHNLWQSGTTIPRSSSLCEHVLVAHDDGNSHSDREIPVSVVSDLVCDSRFCNRYDIEDPSNNRFYAGAPIRSPKGINIGVICVFGDKPRDGLDSSQTKFLRDISQTIMQHWESKATATNFTKSVRMIRGLGSFVEGKATMPEWLSDITTEPNLDLKNKRDSFESQQAANLRQAQFTMQSGEPQAQRPDPTPLQGQSSTYHDDSGPTSNSGQSLPDSDGNTERAYSGAMSVNTNVSVIRTNATVSTEEPIIKAIQDVLSRAASIIREAVEIEGVMFLDASVGSFGGLVPDSDTGSSSSSIPSSTLSGGTEATEMPRDQDPDGKMCSILGYSTSGVSSIRDKSCLRSPEICLPERLLRVLLGRYPGGKVFNLDDDGTEHSTDEVSVIQNEITNYSAVLDSSGRDGSASKRSSNPFSKKNEEKTLKTIFPDACSIAFVPLWESRKERWFAGSILWSNKHTQSFKSRDELSYLRAFGSTIMAEIASIDSSIAEKATSDLLGSLSHELRSPLHGVIAAVELLQDTDIDAFQGNLVHTMESCGRTLLDSIDHLLDYTKINRLMKQPRRHPDPQTIPSDHYKSFQSQMTNVSSTVELASLAEETVESIFAGHNFHKMSIAQLINHEKLHHRDVRSLRRLDSAQAIETFSANEVLDLQTLLSGEDPLSIYLDIDPTVPWLWHIAPGAIRRIIMNLLGNSLKFTKRGFVIISLRQERSLAERGGGRVNLILNVTDSGKGIASDFLMNHAFKAFSQEDSLTPGTGLGLSIVHQITKSLGGSVEIESQLQRGTSVTVSIPLRTPLSDAKVEPSFSEHLRALRGFRVALLGLDDVAQAPGISDQCSMTEAHFMETICRDWLQLDITSSESPDIHSDMILCTDSYVARIGPASPTESQPPMVVICRSAVAAHSLSEKYSNAYGKGVYEFISQPVGPRKLASAMVFALGKYNDSRASELLTIRSSISSQSMSDMSSTVSSTTPTPFTEQMTPLLDVPEMVMGEDTTPGITLPLGPTKPEAEAHKEQPESTATTPPHTTPDPIVSITPATPIPDETTRSTAAALDADNVGKTRCLLVDDNDINLRILASFMKKLNYSYRTATNGLEALELYAAAPEKYRHILMDLSMPVMDGMESTRRIRELERARHLEPASIIALTGLASADAQKEAFASGINLYMTKPVRFKELAKVLADLGDQG